jgi:ribonuclease BN (tRNA processing enzyme)
MTRTPTPGNRAAGDELRDRLVADATAAERENRNARAEEKRAMAHALATRSTRKPSRDCPVQHDPLPRIISELSRHSSAIEEYHDEARESGLDNVLAVLRGWSSATPLVARVEQQYFHGHLCRGGGYFIKASGQGIALDPGYDFLDNFTRGGFHVKEITDVLVSHNHPDHRDDLGRLSDLDYQYLGSLPEDVEPRAINWYLDPDTHADYREVLLHNDVAPVRVVTVKPDTERPMPPGVQCHVFPTDHGKGHLREPCGFVLDLPVGGRRLRLGYTSDTAYSDRLAEQFEGCGLIVCHFSSAHPRDYTGEEPHRNHLGYTGLLNLIRQTDAELYVLSEFWGGKGDVRFELVQLLKYDLGCEGRDDVRILAGDVGLLVDLDRLGIHCSKCGQPVEYERIRTLSPPEPFGELRYVCDRCLT